MKDEGKRSALISPSPGQDTRRDGRSRNSRGKMAEGARFELADGLPHLRFSRPARSAAPSPLQTDLFSSYEYHARSTPEHTGLFKR